MRKRSGKTQQKDKIATAARQANERAGDGQSGFSLPETLVALLLFALSFSALMNYQLALTKGFQLQIQQREAWRMAWLNFEGYRASGWQMTSERISDPTGCQRVTSVVVSPAGRDAALTLLRCEANDAL